LFYLVIMARVCTQPTNLQNYENGESSSQDQEWDEKKQQQSTN